MLDSSTAISFMYTHQKINILDATMSTHNCQFIHCAPKNDKRSISIIVVSISTPQPCTLVSIYITTRWWHTKFRDGSWWPWCQVICWCRHLLIPNSKDSSSVRITENMQRSRMRWRRWRSMTSMMICRQINFQMVHSRGQTCWVRWDDELKSEQLN